MGKQLYVITDEGLWALDDPIVIEGDIDLAMDTYNEFAAVLGYIADPEKGDEAWYIMEHNRDEALRRAIRLGYTGEVLGIRYKQWLAGAFIHWLIKERDFVLRPCKSFPL